MRKLDKTTIAQRDELQTRLMGRYSDLEVAVDAFNSALEEQWAKVEQAMNDYNEAIGDANSWQGEVASDIQSYMDERSEKWLEGEKGQAYDEWRREFEDEIPTADLEKPEELDLSQVEDAAEILGNRREEIDSL